MSELKAELAVRKLDVKGNKADLAQRLQSALDAEEFGLIELPAPATDAPAPAPTPAAPPAAASDLMDASDVSLLLFL